jgi:hypothetical protein
VNLSISTRNKHLLPNIADFTRISRAAAMLDAIMVPEPELRYFSVDKNWAPGTVMMSMRNGSGDEYFATVSSAGAIIKGFDHECPMSPWNSPSGDVWPGVLESVPPQFGSFLSEEAFMAEDTTFCLWNVDDAGWNCGDILLPPNASPADPLDGSAGLLWIFDGQPETYRKHAEDYFEVDLPLDAITKIYQLQPLTQGLVRSLNVESSLADVQTDIAEIGYPAG